jgi:hypothetical protein
MPDDLEVMMRNQIRNNLTHALDSAVQAGDIKAAREATQQLADLHVKNVKASDVPQFNNADIRAAMTKQASWFGVDPRRSAKAVEFGKNMEPQAFKSAAEFAEALVKAVNDEFDGSEEAEEEAEEEEEKEEKKVARKRSDAPSGDIARAIPRRSSGPWTKLADAPKDVADTIRSAAEKFTRNASKEQKEKYVATALGTAYAADQRAKGRK